MRSENGKSKYLSQKLNTSVDLDPLIERVGDAKLVLLGEATHGTHEFYTWRTAISKRLIEEKGFNFIAVEGDWPDCYKVNRYIKGFDDNDKNPQEVLKAFNRWPTWMWANWEVAALVSWLKNHNSDQLMSNRVGFYGLDVYSLWESLDILNEYLKVTDQKAFEIAEHALECFSGFNRNEQQYARHSLSSSCKEEVINLLHAMKRRSHNYNHDPEAALNTIQNAEVAVNAEKYYRNMISFDDQTWNIRDTHMMYTLNRLLEFHGESSKAIIWEHNTHIGDARHTDMKGAGMLNTGQLSREMYGEKNTVLVGFSTYSGTVIAGNSWGAPMREMEIPNGKDHSLEGYLHQQSAEDKLIIWGEGAPDKFSEVMGHRAIGVVYNPGRESYNYVPSVANKRYDAMIYLDQTTALHPLHIKADLSQVPETYPFEF